MISNALNFSVSHKLNSLKEHVLFIDLNITQETFLRSAKLSTPPPSSPNNTSNEEMRKKKISQR